MQSRHLLRSPGLWIFNFQINSRLKAIFQAQKQRQLKAGLQLKAGTSNANMPKAADQSVNSATKQ
jgi:hypothetical protein